MDVLKHMGKMSAAGAVAGFGTAQVLNLMKPDAAMARSRSGENAQTVSRSWVRPMHVAMGRELAESRFSKGSWWIWQYSDGEGRPYSWERYSVIGVDGDEVLIDMATTLQEHEPFATHHRMHLSLGEVLSAKEDHRQWKFRKFGYLRDERWWEAPHNDNVQVRFRLPVRRNAGAYSHALTPLLAAQAFEEKFDEFLMAPASAVTIESDRRCDVAALGETLLVQSARHSYTGAWYVQAPARHAGVAGLKYFGTEGDPSTYRFELVAMGSERADDTPTPNYPCRERVAIM